MPETYGYIRTSRPRVSELTSSDPETQRQQLLAAGVALSRICGPRPAQQFTVGKEASTSFHHEQAEVTTSANELSEWP